MKPEHVLCAAVEFYAKGSPDPIVLSGLRHADCINMVTQWFPGIRITQKMQGFLTSTGRFVSREEAAELAWAAGQIPKLKDQLFSEDLY